MQLNQPSRRQALKSAACGFGSLAMAGLLAEEANADNPATPVASKSPLLPKQPQFPARAKRVIFIFMQGGVSQVDAFDPKPELQKRDGQKLEFLNARSMSVKSEKLMKNLWKFKQHGECGRWVSELFPHQAEIVDDLCFVQSMHTEGVAHGPSTLFLHTGATNLIRPSVGSWITYGLGTENQNLPGFVTVQPSPTKGGPRNYGNAFLPTAFQGTSIGRAEKPIQGTGIASLTNEQLGVDDQRARLDLLQQLNREQATAHDDELEAVVGSYELAWRMQNHAPEVLNLKDETDATLKMYGIGKGPTDYFGKQCLMARRMAEAGVRYIQLNYSDYGATPKWDQHGNMPQHATHALNTDQPVAALIKDLKQRGLLEDTLVWWGSEFGRTPFSQGNDGRDHNPNGFTIWLAGGGVKPGYLHGKTDEFGYNAIEDKVHMHDLHATILHLLGLNHKELTHRYAGRDFRLTDVHGRVVKELFA
jgi:hypothetical protein